mmetsp:Transcript_6613/g.23332  ORF Transcript_6613/g.23332 Transcript_6613/m.23332 type:complete len:1080 (-) Transcript_6613:319-3558(-)|eukprot:CAMPEP_0183799206 /NCGR_PEP_ID=MMETSP0803_2-20130417/20970_1 /TAXON_ID=195967 /ORGANISM="Crustomastix stigmata, Strain CCMP3273" /LENGTH=1079 /DNA_ID=CAMNT_0026043903 /DNA_START=215 /DNA_END=3454 /DNA_ORIENTATION=-
MKHSDERKVECDPQSVVLHGGTADRNGFSLDFLSKSSVFNERATRYAYSELGISICQLTALFRTHNVNFGEFVINLLQRGPLLLAVVSALWVIDAINVPLDCTVPHERITRIKETTGAQKCIQSGLTAQTDKIFSVVLNVDLTALTENLDNSHPTMSMLGNCDTNTCYCIFTSGSTGAPKGVEVSQKNICVYINGMVRTFRFSSQDVFFCQTSIGFDASINEIHLPLVLQAGHVSFADAVRLNTFHFVKALKKFNPTLVQCTPSVWTILLPEMIRSNIQISCTALCGGEKLTSNLRIDLLKCFMAVLDQYGPTEATVGCANKLYKNESRNLHVSNGTPLPGDVVFCFLDGRITHEGEAGELVCCGEKVAKYCTANHILDKFVLLKIDGVTLPAYFTGDLAQVSNSEVHILGRADSQIKINGQRVELEEIESCLEQLECVRESICIFTDFLKAYLVPNSGSITYELIVEHLSKHLPTAWVPRKYFMVGEIKLNQNRKKDRKYIYESQQAKPILPSIVGTYKDASLKPVMCAIKDSMNEVYKTCNSHSPLQMLGNSIQLAHLLNSLQSKGYSIDFDRKLLELNAYELSEKLQSAQNAHYPTSNIQTMWETLHSACAIQNKHGMDFDSKYCILFCSVLQGLRKFHTAALGALGGYENKTLSLWLPVARYANFNQHTVLTRFDLLQAFLFDDAELTFENFDTNSFEAALRFALCEFPFINCSMNIVNDQGNAYCIASQQMHVQVQSFQSCNRAVRLVQKLAGLSIAIFSYLALKVRLQHYKIVKFAFWWYFKHRGTFSAQILPTVDGHSQTVQFTISHLLADGWTQRAFYQTLCTVYDELIEGKSPNLSFGAVKAAKRYIAIHKRVLAKGKRQQNQSEFPDILDLPFGMQFPHQALFGIYTTSGSRQVCLDFTDQICNARLNNTYDYQDLHFLFAAVSKWVVQQSGNSKLCRLLHRTCLYAQGNLFDGEICSWIHQDSSLESIMKLSKESLSAFEAKLASNYEAPAQDVGQDNKHVKVHDRLTLNVAPLELPKGSLSPGFGKLWKPSIISCPEEFVKGLPELLNVIICENKQILLSYVNDICS